MLTKDPEIRDALRSCSTHFLLASLYTVIGSILLLAFPLYLWNVYGRVLQSHSLATLAVLLTGFIIAILFRGVFDWLRNALLVRAATRIERKLSDRVVECLFERRASGRSDIGSQALRDLDQFRRYVTGAGGHAVMDAPLGALFLGVLIILNIPLAVTALVAILIITALTVIDVRLTREQVAKSEHETLNSYGFVDANLPAAEAIVGMGLTKGMLAKWHVMRQPALDHQVHASSRSHAFDELIGITRYVAQGVFIAVGAIEVINGTLNPGLLIAMLFILNFAMAPFNRVVQAWSSYPPVKQGLERLETLLKGTPRQTDDRMPLPRPDGELRVVQLSYVPPAQDRMILRNINFGLRPGESLGVVGLIGSGKTTLARLLVGALKPSGGSVRLDGNEVSDWIRHQGGAFIGYVPQSVGLLSATVAENIGRFGMFGEAEIVKAAELAGVHELIQKLPRGYDTRVGEGGHQLSGGQRQLIALARAVVGDPRFLVLDEPNSNLDGPGEEALGACLEQLRAGGTTIVLVSHRPHLVRNLDKLLLLKDGALVAFGATADVWSELGRPMVVKRGGGEDERKLEAPAVNG